jgi:hypothetical protein
MIFGNKNRTCGNKSGGLNKAHWAMNFIGRWSDRCVPYF